MLYKFYVTLALNICCICYYFADFVRLVLLAVLQGLSFIHLKVGKKGSRKHHKIPKMRISLINFGRGFMFWN